MSCISLIFHALPLRHPRIVFTVVTLVLYPSLFGATWDETQDAKNRLVELHLELSTISEFTEGQNLGRLRWLRQSTNQVLQMIDDKGLGNRNTLNSYDVLLISLANSKLFLQLDISSDFAKPHVERIEKIYAEIEDQVGKPSAGRMTHTLFTEMKRRLDEINKNINDTQFKEKYEHLLADFSEVLSTSDIRGDVPETYRLALPLSTKVKAELYPSFSQIDQTEAAYGWVIDFMGLVDLFDDMTEISK